MRKNIVVLLSMFFLTGAIVGCTEEIATISTSNDYSLANDLKEMTSRADVIVLGSYQGYLYSENGDRDMDDPSKESSDSYSETKVYAFEVDEVLKGDVPKNIKVNLHYSWTEDDLRDEEENPIKLTIKSQIFVEPKLSNKYVLFLNKAEFTDGYVSASLPFEIRIDEQNKAILHLGAGENETIVQDENGKKYRIVQESIDLYEDKITGKDLKELIQEIKQYK
jgi:hypothetical protein